jgi:pimeloyl-ACP methyl ester carboxylesterase
MAVLDQPHSSNGAPIASVTRNQPMSWTVSRLATLPVSATVSALNHLATSVTVSTLIVWGARDRIIPASHAATVGQLIDGSRIELFERAGHFPHLDEPERFAQLLREFIATETGA